MARNQLVISGAREHNLKDISISLPRDALVVITGLSGSGKSSLAFDTIYAEGQRRYVESLSAYARQFLGQMDKPDVDSIEGLSPAISIDQKTTSRNPRSTVGTVTEIYDYLRLLWARIGTPHCPNCGKPIAGQSAEQIIDQVMALEEGTRFMVLAPVVRGRKGEYGKLLDDLRAEGFTRVKVDGELRRLEEDITLDKKFKHDIAVVVDRLVMRDDLRKRLADSVETAVTLADGIVQIELVQSPDGAHETADPVLTFSEKFACLDCGISMPELEPRIFSFNSPHGACPHCDGLGAHREIDPELVVPDPSLSIGEGALSPWANSASNYYEQITEAIADRYGVDLFTGPTARRFPSTTAPATAAGGRTRRRSRGSFPTSSAATARPTPSTAGRRSRSTCRSGRARSAGEPACGPSRGRSRSAGWRSTSSPRSRRTPRSGGWTKSR
jgi:excinuclease ABC subunit A